MVLLHRLGGQASYTTDTFPPQLCLQPVTTWSYPPVPYPPISQDTPPTLTEGIATDKIATTAVSPGDSNIEPAGTAHSAREPTVPQATPVTIRTSALKTPFKTPRRLIPPPALTSPSAAPSSPTPTEAAPSPVAQQKSPPPAPRCARGHKAPLIKPPPFVSPALKLKRRASSCRTTSPAVQLSALEKKVRLLRQARKYRLATLLGNKNGDGNLEALCDKWKEAGRAAADMLWNKVGSSFDTGGNGGSSSTDIDSRSCNGWDLPYSPSGASASLRRRGQDSPFTLDSSDSSWGFSAPSSFSGFSSTFADRQADQIAYGAAQLESEIVEEMQATGQTREEVLEKILARDEREDLPSLDVLLKTSKKKADKKRQSEAKGRASAAKKAKVESSADAGARKDIHEYDDGDELLRAADEIIRASSSAEQLEWSSEKLDGAMVDIEVDEPSSGNDEEPDWTIGSFLKTVGIDASLFGWSEEEGGYAD